MLGLEDQSPHTSSLAEHRHMAQFCTQLAFNANVPQGVGQNNRKHEVFSRQNAVNTTISKERQDAEIILHT